MKYFIGGLWYTELGRRVKLNDLLNNIRAANREMEELRKVMETFNANYARAIKSLIRNRRKGKMVESSPLKPNLKDFLIR